MSKGNRTKGPRAGRPRLPKKELGVMTSMRLDPATRSQIGQLAKRWRRPDGERASKTDVVERAINEAYGREVFGPLYVSPLDPRNPQHSANETGEPRSPKERTKP